MKLQKQNYWAYYVALVIIGGVLLFFSMNHPVRKGGLYGVVESPKVRLNHPRKATVMKVSVVPGQKVNKGEVLMELGSEAVDDDLERIAYREKQLTTELEQELFQLQIEQKEFELEVLQDEQEWTQEKREIEASLSRDRTLLNKFSGSQPKDTLGADWRIQYLDDIIKSKQTEVKLKQGLLEQKKQLMQIAYKARNEELLLEKQRLIQEKQSLTLVAPASGTVDNVYFMEGQTADAFTDLLSLLPDENKYVRAYVTEQTAQLPEFTSVTVQSVLNKEKTTPATYIGSGGVELLPAQIQDSPVQLSGKEIFFRLENTEGWLQGEKVMILVQ